LTPAVSVCGEEMKTILLAAPAAEVSVPESVVANEPEIA
jgi:hypothetical protein